MSRLQVGGLALVIGGLDQNLGKIVKLVSFVGSVDNTYAKGSDYWLSESDGLVGRMPSGIIKPVSRTNIKAIHLLPLGDKQTQDELSKEKETEYT